MMDAREIIAEHLRPVASALRTPTLRLREADCILAALSDAGYTIAKTEPVAGVFCPGCHAFVQFGDGPYHRVPWDAEAPS